MTTRRLRIPGGAGAILSARWDIPDGDIRGHVLLAHSFGSSKDLRSTGRLVDAFLARGFGAFRFDFTGVGQSEGSFADTTFTTNVADVLAMAAAMRAEGAAPRLLFGHSLGGAAAIRAARDIPECAGVAVLAAPSSTEHLARVLLGRAPRLREEGEVEIETIGKFVRVKAAMLDDFARHDLLNDVAKLGRPLLVVHSTADTVTGIEHGQRLFEAAQFPKGIFTLGGADHLLLQRESDARFVGGVISAWAKGILE